MNKFPADSVGLVEAHDLKLSDDGKPWKLNRGELPELVVRYEVYGQMSELKDNVILICAPLTADAHAAGYHSITDKVPGWWEPIIGPGKAIDTNKFCVICSNNLGGCKGTTGPASINPQTGNPYGSQFPHISIDDMVQVQQALVQKLGIKNLAAVVGGSMGGFMAMKWAIDYPEMVKKCIIIATTTRLSTQALGFESVGRSMIVNGPEFNGGDYYQNPDEQICVQGPVTGLSHARQLAHITYLSAIALERKHARHRKREANPDKFQTGFAVETYLEYQGQKFLQRFDANSYLHITWAMDQFDLEEEYGSLAQAFSSIDAEVLNINLSTDWLFPPPESRLISLELLNQQKIVSSVELDTPYGHDGFLLKDMPDLSSVMGSFLDKEQQEHSLESHDLMKQRKDYLWLEKVITPKSRVLDLGCGDGTLIDALWHAHKICGVGMEKDLNSINACLAKNVPVLQWDLNHGLSDIADDSFDFVIVNKTLQEVEQPVTLLREVLRIAKKAVINFPNFGYWRVRNALMFRGRMPKSRHLPHEWYDTPNIHLFTYRDFQRISESEGIRIEKKHYISDGFLGKTLNKLGYANLGAEQVVALISRE